MAKNIDVLVIDDEQVILDAVQRICRAEQHTVDSALEAGSALKKIDQINYGIILCDLMLPDIDGFKFLDLLNQKKINTPVIMTSGFSTMENAVKSLDKGAIDFIPKPFTSDELCSAISRGLRYIKIKENEQNATNGSIVYVSCPPKYYRLGYSTWISKDPRGSALVGLTDLFLKTVLPIIKVNLMSPEEEIYQGSYCASIINDNEVQHPVLAPLSGRILEINNEVQKNTSLLEKDPYFGGWLYRIVPSDYEYEIKNLVSGRLEMI